MKKLTVEEEITKQTYQKIASRWAKSHSNPKFWYKEMEAFRRTLPKGKILDVGAGSGRDAKGLIELGYDYIGIDISDALLKEARKTNPGVDFREASLYDLEFSELFDGFWCAAVLLHIPRDRMKDALRSIKKCLKPGAVGFIAIKEGKGERMLDRSEDDQRYFAYWDNDEFKNLLKKCEFTICVEGKKHTKDEPDWLTYIVKCA